MVTNSKIQSLGNGRFYFSNHRGIGLCALDGHTFDQVDNTINTASGQLTPGKLGIVTISVNLAGELQHGDQHKAYLWILGDAISDRIWGGGRNTRIGAILLRLSAKVQSSYWYDGKWSYNRTDTLSRPIIQPVVKSPDDAGPSSLISCLLAAEVQSQGDNPDVTDRSGTM
jgi:hypothetical protein